MPLTGAASALPARHKTKKIQTLIVQLDLKTKGTYREYLVKGL